MPLGAEPQHEGRLPDRPEVCAGLVSTGKAEVRSWVMRATMWRGVGWSLPRKNVGTSV